MGYKNFRKLVRFYIKEVRGSKKNLNCEHGRIEKFGLKKKKLWRSCNLTLTVPCRIKSRDSLQRIFQSWHPIMMKDFFPQLISIFISLQVLWWKRMIYKIKNMFDMMQKGFSYFSLFNFLDHDINSDWKDETWVLPVD